MCSKEEEIKAVIPDHLLIVWTYCLFASDIN